VSDAATAPISADPSTRIAELEAMLAASQAQVARLEAERDALRAAHERLRQELELLRRRIFVAKAERVDTEQLELQFREKLAELDRVAGTLGLPATEQTGQSSDEPPPRKKPTGRRALVNAPIEERRIELSDPLFEALVEQGRATRIGFEESYKLGWQRGGMRRVVLARVKYATTDAQGESVVETTPMPPQSFPRSLASPSLVAHVAMAKHGEGMPLFRLEDRFARDGVPLDRGTMCRWLEDAGATAGATVIQAMRTEALRTAFCIATDATGVAIQPERVPDAPGRKPCRRGHYFVQIADRDHVFFEYTPKETSAAVGEMFRGFSGYVQADAKSVFDILFREPEPEPPDGEPPPVRMEVGCWSHARRKFWEAAIAKNVVAREALVRVGRIFELDASWRKKPPAEIKRLRQAHLRAHVDAFFEWATAEYEKVLEQRGALRSALGYVTRNQAALVRFLDDGRLEMTNNGSERELRRVAVGRKAWLFAGSDEHAQSAGHLLSLIASARLHRLDPEAYLCELFRVIGHWPRERYLELAPKYWAATRARLDAAELATEIGPLTIPPPESAAEEQVPG
jgi:transposase